MKSIKIPIPSLDKQQEIVKYLDFIYEKANKTSNEKIAELKMLNEFCLNNQKIFGDNVVKILEEVCDIDKKVKNMKRNMVNQLVNINFILAELELIYMLMNMILKNYILYKIEQMVLENVIYF